MLTDEECDQLASVVTAAMLSRRRLVLRSRHHPGLPAEGSSNKAAAKVDVSQPTQCARFMRSCSRGSASTSRVRLLLLRSC